MKDLSEVYFRINWLQKALLICICLVLLFISVIKSSNLRFAGKRETNLVLQPIDSNTFTSAVTLQKLTASNEFSLSIPKIDLKAPIIPYIDGNNKTEYLNA